MSKYIKHRRSREGRNALWSLAGAGAVTGWRLRHGESDRGTTTGRFINKHVKGAVKYVKRQVKGADIVRDIKRAAKRGRRK